MDVSTLKPGDRVWWWWETNLSPAQVAVTVVRVNRKTVTVLNGWNEQIRVRHEVIEGLVDWE